jgi:hypothetical protein
MERFGYPSLKAVYEESTDILRLLEAESYGTRRDEEEAMAEKQQQMEMQQRST